MEAMLLLGVYSNIPALHEFCVIAAVSVFSDFLLQVPLLYNFLLTVAIPFLQVIFYVAVLSLDIRRMELSDLSRPRHFSQSVRVFRAIGSGEQNTALEKALKNTADLTTIVLNSSFVVLSMVSSFAWIMRFLNTISRLPPCFLRC